VISLLTQLQVLNFILKSGDSTLITIKGLTSDYFPQLRQEFNFIYNHFKQYNQIPDLATFLNNFPEFEVIEVNESVDYLLSELTREKKENLSVKSINEAIKLLKSGKTDEGIQYLTNSLNEIGSNKQMEAIDILSDISRYDSYIDKCNNIQKYYVSTGFKELDEIIGGWDRKEEYATIQARSGIGKTWVMIKSITAAVERGLTVGVFEGEMSVDKIGYRFDTLMSHLSNGKLIHGNIDIAVNYKNYLDELKDNHKGKLYVLTRDMIDGKCGVNALRGFVDKYNLDILFIDQHSLLDDDRGGKTTWDRATNISRDIKILQVTKHIPIITISQQNRSAIEEGKFAGTENVSNSDRIAQDSTVILSLSQNENVMTVYITKSRDGGSFKKIKYAINLDKGTFEYIPEEEDASGSEGEQKVAELQNRYSQGPSYDEANGLGDNVF